MSTRAVVGIAVLGVLAASGAASATSTTSTTTTSSANPAQGSVVRGVTPTTIKVEGIGDALLFGSADVGAKARFARENAAGGVNGRTIDYVGMRDDQGIGVSDEQVGAQLVEQDQVFAVVPVVTPDLGAGSVFAEQKVPYFGWAVSSNFCGNRYGFGFSGCVLPPGGRVTSDAWGRLVKTAIGPQVPNPTAVILAESTPSGRYMVGALTAAAKSAGLSVVGAVSYLPVPPVGDYGALAKGVMGANQGKPPDAVFVAGSYSNVALMKRALRDAGFAGVFTDNIEYDPDLVAAASTSSVMLQTAALETAPTNPAVQQLINDVKAVAPDVPIDQPVMAGYWAADLFIAALKRAGKDLTVASLLKAANSSFTYRVPDTVGPTKFPTAHRAPTPCGTLVRSDGTAFTVQVPYTCGTVVPVKQ
ncbi:MAG TPA: ABC transporter substrate-binding protein [Acidimicrobiia bacterium]|nr:ABC transporter substrate-binding protein [Acidimicrobiia bacterium]